MTEQIWNGIKDFSAGLIDNVEDHLLPDNASPDCLNVVSETVGSLQKRRGQARLGAQIGAAPVRGMHAFYRGAQRFLIAACGNDVFRYDFATGQYMSLRSGLSAIVPTCFATTVHFMVAFNGVNPPWRWDGTSTALLANAPIDGQFAVLFKEKLFTVPLSTPSTLRWANSFQPEVWSPVNFWDIRPGDGDVISNIVEHLGDLVVFKRRSTHTLAGTDLNDFRLDLRHSSIGCVGPFAAAPSGAFLYFVSEEGLCVWNGMNVINLSRERIPKLWGRINQQNLHRAAATVQGRHILFALPEGNSTTNNLVVVCEHARGGDAKFWVWRGIDASCFQQFNDGNNLLLYSGDALSGWVNRQQVGWEDFGAPINAYWQGKSYDIGSAEHKKKFREVWVIDSPEALDVELQVSLDYGVTQQLVSVGGDTLVRRFKFPPGSYGRYLSPRLIHNRLGSLDVRGLTVTYTVQARMR